METHEMMLYAWRKHHLLHSMLYQLIFDVIFSTTRNYNKSDMLFRFWLVCSREERWWSEWRRMQSLLSFGDMSIQLVKLNMLLRNEWSVMVFPHFGGDMNKQNCQILRWSKIIHHFIAAAKLTHHICAPISTPRIVYILANADVMCMLWYERRLFGMLFLSISQLSPPPPNPFYSIAGRRVYENFTRLCVIVFYWREFGPCVRLCV